ncbi:MarR family winged helix-turn-helix transcriptional regulator [Flexivirga lutea]
MPEPDLLDSSYYRPLFQLLHAMDQDIEAVYASRGRAVGSRSVGPLISLSRNGPMTVKELAIDREVSHSAMSQTVAGLTRDGYVRSDPGTDARTRVISLTPEGEELIPLLRAEWRSTEAVLRGLDDQSPHPIMQAVDALAAALADKPFRERLEESVEHHLHTGDPS